jgi:tetratricopeptide (TPR) repeat protein
MRWQLSLCAMLLAVVMWNGAALTASGEEYPTYQAAMSAANKFLKERNFKDAQAPLEAALKMAPGDREKLQIYGSLTQSYRLLPENDKMIEASEYRIANTKSDLERANAAQSLAVFLRERGKLDDARKMYDEELTKKPGDLVALSMLTAIAGTNRRDKDTIKKYQAELDKVEQQRSVKLAEEEEKLAAANPGQATEHWKQAALYRLRASEPAKALADAKQAEATGPDKRTELIEYFWHAQLGDVYLQAGAPKDAIPHFERAIAITKIAGSKESCEKKLAEAKAKLAEKK